MANVPQVIEGIAESLAWLANNDEERQVGWFLVIEYEATKDIDSFLFPGEGRILARKGDRHCTGFSSEAIEHVSDKLLRMTEVMVGAIRTKHKHEGEPDV